MGNSRIAGFYKLNIKERLDQVISAAAVMPEDLFAWASGGIDLTSADHMIENVIGMIPVPIGVAVNDEADKEEASADYEFGSDQPICWVSGGRKIFEIR